MQTINQIKALKARLRNTSSITEKLGLLDRIAEIKNLKKVLTTQKNSD